MRTLDRDEVPRFLAIFPRQMVVFVRMPGCSSLAVLARYLSSSPLIVRSDSLPMMTSTDFRVCSRTTGATSVKPDTNCGKILSFTTFCGSLSIINGRLSSRQTRMARSEFANSRMTTGCTRAVKSSSDSLVAIFMTTPKAFGPPPPNSTAFSNSGKTFILKKSSGKSSVSWSRSSRNSSFSLSDLTPRLSIPSVSLIKTESKNAPDLRPCSRNAPTVIRALGLAFTRRL